jgi:plasmid stabilization system protein ParE
MPRLIWAPPALLDVQRLYRFLAGKNLDAAKRAVQAVRQGVRVLGHQPQIGRPIEDMEEAYREWQVDFGDSGYVVRYRVASEAVIILAIRHQKETGS